jgi:hypothetical protein
MGWALSAHSDSETLAADGLKLPRKGGEITLMRLKTQINMIAAINYFRLQLLFIGR